MNASRYVLLTAGAVVAATFGLLATLGGARSAGAQAPADRQQFQQVLLIPPDDQDYVITQIPAGMKAVVTDVVAYNVLDGKSHKVTPGAESYIWLGGYPDGKSVALINRLRILGNETQQWRLNTGLELKGAPDLRASSEKLGPASSPALLYVTGYFTK